MGARLEHTGANLKGSEECWAPTAARERSAQRAPEPAAGNLLRSGSGLNSGSRSGPSSSSS
jgi:hypothetical protein